MIEGVPTLGDGRMPPPFGPLMTPGPLDAFPPGSFIGAMH
jgi:hypothetical protein